MNTNSVVEARMYPPQNPMTQKKRYSLPMRSQESNINPISILKNLKTSMLSSKNNAEVSKKMTPIERLISQT